MYDKKQLKFSPIFSHRQWKCTTCQKVMDSKLQLEFHNKVHTEAWNVSSMEADSSEKELISSSSVLPSLTTLDVRVDADSSVSEKVLMDAVAEKKNMDYADVSITELFAMVCDILHWLYNI